MLSEHLPKSCMVSWNSFSSSILLNGKIFSLHILQNQSALFLIIVNSSQESAVQFLWTCLWQQLQSMKYECFKIFLSHMGQVFSRSAMMICKGVKYKITIMNTSVALVVNVGHNHKWFSQRFLWWQITEIYGHIQQTFNKVEKSVCANNKEMIIIVQSTYFEKSYFRVKYSGMKYDKKKLE